MKLIRLKYNLWINIDSIISLETTEGINIKYYVTYNNKSGYKNEHVDNRVSVTRETFNEILYFCEYEIHLRKEKEQH